MVTAPSTTYKTREGSEDRTFSDLRAGIELSGGMVCTLYGAQLAPAEVNAFPVGVVGNYYNSGELVDLTRDGRVNIKAAENLGAGKPVCPAANGLVEEFTSTRRTNGAHLLGFTVAAVLSGLYVEVELNNL